MDSSDVITLGQEALMVAALIAAWPEGVKVRNKWRLLPLHSVLYEGKRVLVPHSV